MLKGNLNGWFVMEPHEWHDSWRFRDALITAHVDYDVPVLFNYDVWPQWGSMHKNEIVVSYSKQKTSKHSLVIILFLNKLGSFPEVFLSTTFRSCQEELE